MASIHITINEQKYVLKGEESEEHLHEVAEMVRRKVEGLRKKTPSMSLAKAAMLAAFDLASQSIKGQKRAVDYQAHALARATELLELVETELAEKP